MSSQVQASASVGVGEWLKKFVWNRFLYMVLLFVLCIGIFPFVVLYCFTSVVARWVDKVSPQSKFAAKTEHVWDVIGVPYDALVKLVG